ncbi:magnesium transporter [Marchantia polymorpha subsp. ruderalis]|uniref:Magnesium transporter n=2 Tax=Marchantia polymorpha TaxID=3197 RepID=A0AAF6ARV0_MARPO|nr:hypothetical protein MARPO_0001s0270 [Marchantia polymorpha]BBM99170.1 hypothetical protein Mp_1g19320 [Marchantia polymorpha subsp. ruderalis]|eukprot:PTQ50247.1 hypothetical protein MARPO_0001s0270 [Marchantia polymorpha]
MPKTIMPLVLPDQNLEKKKAASRSWLLLDANGDSMMLEVDKYAIMHRVGIHARDLRILDPLLSYPSTILGRERAIVLNLEHIKAIITAEEVLLRNPHDEFVIPIVEELCRRLPPKSGRKHMNASALAGYDETSERENKDGSSWDPHNENPDSGADVPPFEFRALEVALEAICSFLDARTTELETNAYPALDELTKKISSRNLDRVRKLKSGMTRLTARIQKVRDELEQLLDDDEDMADLFLTRKMVGSGSPTAPSVVPSWVPASPTIGSRISRASRASTVTSYGHGSDDVEELEMLLEAYFMQIDGTLNKVTTLREYIDDTEDYINIQLDNHRNRLIQLELILSSATVVMAIYSLVAAIFGMNLPYKWNEGYGYIFKWVVILGGVGCLTVFLMVLGYARYKRLIGT